MNHKPFMPDDSKRTRAALFVILMFFIGFIAIVIMVFRKNKIVSPVPEESGIRIIILTPTPEIIIPSETIEPRSGTNYN